MFKKIASLVVVPLFLMLWARFGAQNLTLYTFNALSDYKSEYTAPIAPGKPGDAATNQLVIIVVDALRADVSRSMTNLNALRAKGADRTLQIGEPSLSYPGWTVIGTGAWQEQSGVTLNFYKGDIKVDTIFESAKRKGLTTALAGAGNGWTMLYARGVDASYGSKGPSDPYSNLPAVRREDDDIETNALKILKENKPNLMLIHFIEADDAGHAKGGTSAEYKDAAMAMDARISHIASVLDLNQTTLIVTADHGQIDTGGHGGGESVVLTVPFVAVGKGIKPGKYDPGTLADIAPTIAALIGASIPAHSQGLPMFDALDLSANVRAQRAVDTAQEIADRYAQIAKVYGASSFEHKKLDEAKQALTVNNADAAYQAALADIQSTRAQAASAKDARLNGERLARLPMGLLVLLPFAIYLIIILRANWDWRSPLVGLVVYIVVYNALFFGRGYTWSLSALNSEDQMVAFFTARTVDAMIGLLVATLVVGVLNRRASIYNTALNTLNMAFFVAGTLALQIVLFYVLYDVSFAWYLPNLTLGFKYYLDVLQTSAFWPLVYVPLLALLPFIALGTRWVAARVPMGKR